MWSRVLAFLRDESNRALLGWIGGGVAVAAGGLWAVFTFYVDHSKPPPPPAAAIVEQKGTGSRRLLRHRATAAMRILRPCLKRNCQKPGPLPKSSPSAEAYLKSSDRKPKPSP